MKFGIIVLSFWSLAATATVDTIPLTAPVAGATFDSLWIIDNSPTSDKTIQSLRNHIHVYYDALKAAQIPHMGMITSSDIEKFNADPIYSKTATQPNKFLVSGDTNWVNTFRNRVSLAYSDFFCHNCQSSPAWALYLFQKHIAEFRPKVPMEIVLVTHQMDHYRTYTTLNPSTENYGPQDFLKHTIDSYRKAEKSVRVSTIAPECPTLLENSGVAESVGPPSTYRTIVNGTGGTYLSSGCEFDAPKALKQLAEKSVLRSLAHAKKKIGLSQKAQPDSIRMFVGDRELAPGSWRYDSETNEVELFWHLIDQGQLRSTDQIQIVY